MAVVGVTNLITQGVVEVEFGLAGIIQGHKIHLFAKIAYIITAFSSQNCKDSMA